MRADGSGWAEEERARQTQTVSEGFLSTNTAVRCGSLGGEVFFALMGGWRDWGSGGNAEGAEDGQSNA